MPLPYVANYSSKLFIAHPAFRQELKTWPAAACTPRTRRWARGNQDDLKPKPQSDKMNAEINELAFLNQAMKSLLEFNVHRLNRSVNRKRKMLIELGAA